MHSNSVPSESEQMLENIKAMTSIEDAFISKRTFGQRMADHVARVLGSWQFIIVQSCLLTLWILLNVTGYLGNSWDPYPFILLNLGLSLQAAYASPVLMMSQNRQAALDQKRNKLDLQINLLSEQENTEILKLLRKLCEHVGVDLSDFARSEALSNQMELKELAEDLDIPFRERVKSKV